MLVYIDFVREMFEEALKMTDRVDTFNNATTEIMQKSHGAGYRNGIQAVNLKAIFRSYGIDLTENANE